MRISSLCADIRSVRQYFPFLPDYAAEKTPNTSDHLAIHDENL